MFRKPPSPQKKKKKKIANCVYLMITIEPSCGRQEDVLPRSPFKKGLAALCRIHLETDQDRVTVLASWARCETTLMGKICSGVRAWLPELLLDLHGSVPSPSAKSCFLYLPLTGSDSYETFCSPNSRFNVFLQ